jgi:hypothetical protein
LEEKDCFQEVAFTSTIDEMWERAGTWLSWTSLQDGVSGNSGSPLHSEVCLSPPWVMMLDCNYRLHW